MEKGQMLNCFCANDADVIFVRLMSVQCNIWKKSKESTTEYNEFGVVSLRWPIRKRIPIRDM